MSKRTLDGAVFESAEIIVVEIVDFISRRFVADICVDARSTRP